MQIGTIGLGKMGADMTTYLVNGRHQVVVTDRKLEAVEAATAGGAVPAKSLAELVEKLAPVAIAEMGEIGVSVEKCLAGIVVAQCFELGDGELISLAVATTHFRWRSLFPRGCDEVDRGSAGG